MDEKSSKEMLLFEYQETRSEISEIRRIPEKWGAIMLPLATGILALGVDSMKKLPHVGVVFLVVLSMVTIIIWRLIGYNAMYRIGILSEHLVNLEKKRTKQKKSQIEEDESVFFDMNWQKLMHRPRSFIPLLSQQALLDIFAGLYIMVGISITIVKIYWF